MVSQRFPIENHHFPLENHHFPIENHWFVKGLPEAFALRQVAVNSEKSPFQPEACAWQEEIAMGKARLMKTWVVSA